MYKSVEIELLEKGLSYNLPEYNQKTLDFKEIINVESTIKSIESQDLQNEIREVMNSKINKLSKNKIFKIDKKSKKLNKFKKDVIDIKNIKNKLKNNNALIVKADKGQTVVIIGENEYMEKSYDFINENNIEKINKDPTDEYVKDINNKINKCTKIIQDNQKHALKQIKAKAPEFNALIKLQKQGMPGRPLINHKTAPSYKISKKLNNIIKNNLKIDKNYSIKNNIEFVNKIKNLELRPDYKLVTFDIKSMYTNIPIEETIEILNTRIVKIE